MSNRFTAGKKAISECDRCGFRFKLKELKELVIKTKKINILVCRQCWEPDHPQLQLGMYPVADPQALRNPRPDRSYITSGINSQGLLSDGSRIFQWGWNPVGGGNSDSLTPNDLAPSGVVGTVTVSTSRPANSPYGVSALGLTGAATAVGTSAATDPYFSDVVLLQRFDGNSTPVVGAAFSNSPAYTATNAFSVQSLNSGASTTEIPSSTSAAYDIGAGDFTVEVWARVAATPAYSVTYIVTLKGSDAARHIAVVTGTSNWAWAVATSATTTLELDSGEPWVIGAWTHLAITRQGNVHRTFVNGVLKGTSTIAYRPTPSSVNTLIGNTTIGFPYPFNGLIDEVRFTANIARYTATFTPPTGPFPGS